eukprot:g631.t1
MQKVEICGARMNHHAPDEYSTRSPATDSFGVPVPRRISSANSQTPRSTFSVYTTEESVRHKLEIPRRPSAGTQRRYAEVHTNIHVVNQTNAMLRERLSERSQPASLTKENLMMLEDTLENNRPAEQLRRKREFIQKEMEKSRQKSGSAEAKAALLKKISQREEKVKIKNEARSDSVLEDLRKARFRMVAQMAQKRLQSMSPEVKNLEEDFSSRLDWYLRFCGEGDEDGSHQIQSENTSPFSKTSTEVKQ